MALTVPLILGASNAGRADDPSELLGKLGAAYKALPSYADRGAFVMVVSVDGEEHRFTQPAAITLVRPNRIKVEAGLATMVSDGETLTTIVEPTRKFSTVPAPKTVGLHHVAEGPVGSLLLGGRAGRRCRSCWGFCCRTIRAGRPGPGGRLGP